MRQNFVSTTFSLEMWEVVGMLCWLTYKILLRHVVVGGGGGVWISKPFVSRIKEKAMSWSAFYVVICTWLHYCHSFKPSVCHFEPSFYIWQNVRESYMKQCQPAVVPQGLVCGVAGDSVFVSHPGLFLLIFTPTLPIPIGMVKYCVQQLF